MGIHRTFQGVDASLFTLGGPSLLCLILLDLIECQVSFIWIHVPLVTWNELFWSFQSSFYNLIYMVMTSIINNVIIQLMRQTSYNIFIKQLILYIYIYIYILGENLVIKIFITNQLVNFTIRISKKVIIV